MYWIIVGMKFCCHIVISVPGGSWEFLALVPAWGSAKGPTVGAAEGAWDNEDAQESEQDFWSLVGGAAREATWTMEFEVPLHLRLTQCYVQLIKLVSNINRLEILPHYQV